MRRADPGRGDVATEASEVASGTGSESASEAFECPATLPSDICSFSNCVEVAAELPVITLEGRARTGWDLDLSHLSVEAVTAGEFNLRVISDLESRLRIVVSDASLGIGNRVGHLAVFQNFSNLPGAFLPSQSTILLVDSAFSQLPSDLSKGAVQSALIHAAQHQIHPEFMRGVDLLAREALALQRDGEPQSRQVRRLFESLSARLSSVEKHAT